MCGIFGMVSRKTKPFNKRAFCTMGARNDSRGGDSCGVFIDGLVEYGVDKQKLFINFFRESLLLDTVTECKVALGHCRKASVGAVSVETAQPVVLYNEKNQIDYVLIHNGTIYNYKELAAKYIPDIDITGLTDSQVMARIFYHAGYDALDEYNGGAVFVIHDYRIDKTLVFKGASKRSTYAKTVEEERPLFYCWHNGRFVFSSIFETLYSFYYEETVYYFPENKLMVVRGDKLKLVKEYKRLNAYQSKPVETVSTYYGSGTMWDPNYYKPKTINPEFQNFRLSYDGLHYTDDKKVPLHGVFLVSSYGYVYKQKKAKETWLYEVGFFRGRMLKHPDAFKLIETAMATHNNAVTPEIEMLINMMDFNPYTEDFDQFYWYDGDQLMVPQGEWKWPMADYSCTFDKAGRLIDCGKLPYTGWPTDYAMYTFNEDSILKSWNQLCEGE
jgi:predicted glutamine amidotransferase